MAGKGILKYNYFQGLLSVIEKVFFLTCARGCAIVRTHVEWVSAEDPLADLWRILVRPLQEVDESVAVVAVQPVGALLTGHRHLLHIL